MKIQILRRCNKCHKKKVITEFYRYKSNACLRERCKDCIREDGRKWAEANRQRKNARQLAYWNKLTPERKREINRQNYAKQNAFREKLLRVIFEDNPCVVCSEARHECLTFHHLDPKVKKRGVTSHSFTWRGMLREAEKCLVLCHNCHHYHHRRKTELPVVKINLQRAKEICKAFT